MRVFTSLLTPDQAWARYRDALRLEPLGAERIPLLAALHRVLAEDVVAREELPPFDRSTVDGYAVRAGDVADAAPGHAVDLSLVGEVRMGEGTTLTLGPGQAVRVPTGGILPGGADGVVMQEDTERADGSVSVRRGLRPGDNVIARGEDVRRGDVVLRAGRRLQPQDLGIMAGLGLTAVLVHRRPTVAIFSGGTEIVAPHATPGPGQVRDMNTYLLAGLAQRAGASPRPLPILPDDLDVVLAALRDAVAVHDVVLVSGGSSVGDRDVVADAMAALGPPGIIVHGIAIRPGKPTVLAAAGDRPVIGLPGNPVSAMVIFEVFVRPVIEGLLGVAPVKVSAGRVRARLGGALRGAGEREDYVRVRFESRAGELWAVPLRGKSGLLTSMVYADGIVIVKPHGEGIAEGEDVEVALLA